MKLLIEIAYIIVSCVLSSLNAQTWHDVDGKELKGEWCSEILSDSLELCKEWCLTQTICSCQAVNFAAGWAHKTCIIPFPMNSTPSSSQLIYSPYFIHSYFEDDDDCISNPCMRGRCLDLYKSYICVCPSEYTGLLCEKARTPCKTTQRGIEYTGTESKTISGKVCQRWDSQTPHAHNYSAFQFPDGNLNHNYCRNPSNKLKGPWCLTSKEYLIWEYCDVRFCTFCEDNCIERTDKRAAEYRGKMPYTPDGRMCKRWDQMQSPGSQKYTSQLDDLRTHENFCRNPTPENDRGLWCYTIDPSEEWEWCSHIPTCHQGFLSVQTNAVVFDDTKVLDSTVCQTPTLSSDKMKFIFYLKTPATDILFEFNYRLFSSDHDCSKGDSIAAFTKLTDNGQCKLRSYGNECSKEATLATDGGVQGCRFRCQFEDAFSKVFLFLDRRIFPYEICGARMCSVV